MSKKHRTVGAYWREVGPRIQRGIEARRDSDVEQLLERATAVYAYSLEDIDEKRTQNQQIRYRLEPLMVLGFDLLRGAHAAQVNLSLASAVLCARTSWEAGVTLKFIAESNTPDVYADRFNRFQLVERLKRHYDGRHPMTPDEVKDAVPKCAEWMDPKTDQPKTRVHWTAENWTVKSMAKVVGAEKRYGDLYAFGSLFTHGNALIQNLYRRGTRLEMFADPRGVHAQSLTTVCNCTDLLATYLKFFGVEAPAADLTKLASEIERVAGVPKGNAGNLT